MPRKKRTEAQEARRFGVVLAVLAAALGGWSLWREHAVRALVFGAVAAVAIALPLLVPPLWLRAFRLWMKLAEVLSWVSTRVILGLFFYLVLTPVGLVARLVRKDPLDLAWKDGRPTYWKQKGPIPETIERYEKQY